MFTLLSQSTTTMIIMMMIIIILCVHSWNNNNHHGYNYQFVVLAKSSTAIERSFRYRNNHQLIQQYVISSSGMISFTTPVWGIIQHNNKMYNYQKIIPEKNIDFPIWGISSNTLLLRGGGDDDDEQQTITTMSPSLAPISRPSTTINKNDQQQQPTSAAKKKKKKIKKTVIKKKTNDQQQQQDAKMMQQQLQKSAQFGDDVVTKTITNNSGVDDDNLHPNNDNDKRIIIMKKKKKKMKKKLKKRKIINHDEGQTSSSSSLARPPSSSLIRTKLTDHKINQYHKKKQKQHYDDDRISHLVIMKNPNNIPKTNVNIVISKTKKIAIKKKIKTKDGYDNKINSLKKKKKKKKTLSNSISTLTNTVLLPKQLSSKQTEVNKYNKSIDNHDNNDMAKRRQTSTISSSSSSDSTAGIVPQPPSIKNRKKEDVGKKIIKKKKKVIIKKKKKIMIHHSNQQQKLNDDDGRMTMKNIKTKGYNKKNTRPNDDDDLPIAKQSSSAYDDDDDDYIDSKSTKFTGNNVKDDLNRLPKPSLSQSKQDIVTMEYAKKSKQRNTDTKKTKIIRKTIKKKKKSISIKGTKTEMNTDNDNNNNVSIINNNKTTRRIITSSNNMSNNDNVKDVNNKDLVKMIKKKKMKKSKKKIDMKTTMMKKKKKMKKKKTMKKSISNLVMKEEEEELGDEILINVTNNGKENKDNNDETSAGNITKAKDDDIVDTYNSNSTRNESMLHVNDVILSSSWNSSSLSIATLHTKSNEEDGSSIMNINIHNTNADHDSINSMNITTTIVEDGSNQTKSNSSSSAILTGISSSKTLDQSVERNAISQQAVVVNEEDDMLSNGINNVSEKFTNIDKDSMNDNSDLLLHPNIIDIQCIDSDLMNTNSSTHVASTIDNESDNVQNSTKDEIHITTTTTATNITQSISGNLKDDTDDENDDDDDDTDDEGISSKNDNNDHGKILQDITSLNESKIESDSVNATDHNANDASELIASFEIANAAVSDASEIDINVQTISGHIIEDDEDNVQARMTVKPGLDDSEAAVTEVSENAVENSTSITSHNSSSPKNKEITDEDDSDDSDDDMGDDSNPKQLKHDDENSDDGEDEDDDEEENSEENESTSRIVAKSHGQDEEIKGVKPSNSLLNSLKDPNGSAAERSTLGMTGSYLSGFKKNTHTQVPAAVSEPDIDVEKEELQEGDNATAREEVNRIEADDNDNQIEEEEKKGEISHSEYKQILQDTNEDQSAPSDSTHKHADNETNVSEDTNSAEILEIASDQDGRLNGMKSDILPYDKQPRTNRTSLEGESRTPIAKALEDATDVPELSAAENQRQILENLAIAKKYQDDDSCDMLVSVVTWNLAEESPSEEEASFFRRFRSASRKNNMKRRASEITFEQRGSDIVLISAQECENIKPRRAEGSRSREFRRLMIKMLGKEYVPLAIHLLGGIQFGLFCKSSLLIDVEHVSIADVTCGIGNVFHNKGAIGAFVQMKSRKAYKDSQQTSKSIRMLFVTAHMAAHVSNFAARDADYWRIVNELEAQAPTHFLPPRRHNVTDGRSSGSYLIDSMDRVFFCGDLNYRIDLPRETVESSVKQMMKINEQASYLKRNKVSDEIKWKINKIRKRLLKSDQLYSSISEKRAFIGFSEGPILFPPTFKYDKQSDDYDTSNKQRIPAWTDRILFKPAGTKVLQYDAIQSGKHSDHRPVYGTFRVNLKGRSIAIPNKKKLKVKKQQKIPTARKHVESKTITSRKKVTVKQKSSSKQGIKSNVVDQKLPKKRKKVVVQRIENE